MEISAQDLHRINPDLIEDSRVCQVIVHCHTHQGESLDVYFNINNWLSGPNVLHAVDQALGTLFAKKDYITDYLENTTRLE